MALQEQLDKERQRVDVDHFDVPLREIATMVENGELVVAPEYQRQFRWDEARESELVESIFLGLPIPPIYVATNVDGTWELVDGLQRVSTIIHFVGNVDSRRRVLDSKHQQPLELQSVSKLSQFNGLTFKDIPQPLQFAFQKRALRFTALSDKSQLDVRFDLFERLNRGGVTLTDQEVRACIYRGPFNELLRQLANDSQFNALLKLQRGHQSDGTREEQVLKFFAYLHDRSNFQGNVSKFLNSYMEAMRDTADLEALRQEFIASVQILSDIFGDSPVLRLNTHTTPLNMFEALLVAAAEVNRSDNPAAPHISPDSLTSDTELISYSTKGTNTQRALNGRIDRAITLLSAGF